MKVGEYKVIGKYFKFIWICLSFLFTQNLTANSDKLDSLKKQLNKADRNQKQELFVSLAKSFIELEENDSAIKYLEFIVNNEEQLLKPIVLADVYKDLGLLYQYRGQFKTANEYNFKGLSIKKEINAPPEALASSHSNIALSYQELNQFEKAIEHQKISMQYSLEARDSLRVGERYNMIGGLYFQLQDYDTALVYYNKALQINQRLGNKQFLSLHHLYIGLIHMNKNRLFKSKEAFETALSSYPKDGKKRMKVFIYSNLAVSHLIIGAERDSVGPFHLKQSIANAEKTYELAKELSFLRQMRKATEILYKAHDALGQYADAVEYAKEYIVLNDSMYKEQEQKAISEIQTKYEVEKKESEIAFLDRENEIKAESLVQAAKLQSNQQLIISILVIGFVLIAMLLFWVYRIYLQKKKNNKELEEKNAVISSQNAEREVLLKEIHHRVKNNLQVISSLLDLQTNNITDESALVAMEDGQSRVKAMALIHQNLYQNQDIGTISFEEYSGQLIKQLASIYNGENKVSVELNSADIYFDIDTAIPLGLILNELVSNAYKYAFKTEEKGRLSIKLSEMNKGEYCLEVCDSGPGLPSDFILSKAKSLGLRLVHRLSRQLYGKAEYIYEEGAKFTIRFKDTYQRKLVK